jgi:hypothetical protein
LLQKQHNSEIPKVYLFLEKMYQKLSLQGVLGEVYALLRLFATRRAQQLGIPLVAVREGYEKVRSKNS